MFATIYMFLLFVMVLGSERNLNRTDLKCEGTAYHNVSISAYYCPWSNKHNLKDHRRILAYPLQEYLDNRGKFVTVAGNIKSGISYGTKVCIQELNEQFGIRIPLEVRYHIGERYIPDKPDFSKLSICVRSKEDMKHAFFVNRFRRVTIYV